jgi:hypothetical protein
MVGAAAVAREPILNGPALDIPVAPVVVSVGGTRHVVYELHATNLKSQPLTLASVAIADARGATLASYRDEALVARIGRPGHSVDAPNVIGGGLRAVLYVWLPLDATAAVPKRLRHRVEYRLAPDDRQGSVDGVEADVRGDAVALGPPLRGGPWIGIFDPAMVGGHRTALYIVDGRARIPGRFAIDWVRVDDEGRRAHGDPGQVANHLGFGADVLAVSDAIVADARDDMPDAPTLAASRGPMPLERASGNYVVLDLGGGRFAFYEHLKHGSVRVKPGDRVARGAVVAALGNTGSSSSGPHLHFHVADAPALLAAEGAPWTLDAFSVIGRYEGIAAAESGRRWQAPANGEGGRRSGDMPAPNSVVMFDDGAQVERK